MEVVNFKMEELGPRSRLRKGSLRRTMGRILGGRAGGKRGRTREKRGRERRKNGGKRSSKMRRTRGSSYHSKSFMNSVYISD